MNSPFNKEQAELLNRLLPTLTPTQQIWLSGYLSALTVDSTAAIVSNASQVASVSQATKEVTVLFGSQTGNGQKLAETLSKKLKEKGLQVSLSSMSDFKSSNLKKLECLLIIVSTHGEGDPPDNALPFYEFIHGKRAPQLNNLEFSVLALGDSSYEFFCQTGKDLDKRLEELGGKRIYPRTDCDLDYDEPADSWFENVINALSENIKSTEGMSPSTSNLGGMLSEASLYSRTNPFKAEILENLNLNGRGSNRETRHLEISLEGSNLQYEPGDCLGIYPENHPDLVDELIKTMEWNPDEAVPIHNKGDAGPLREALLKHYEITVLTKPFLEQAVKFSNHRGLHELLKPGQEEKLKAYIKENDLLDLLKDFSPWEGSSSEFISILRKMPARLYSIASSLRTNPDEVHVLIRAVRYETNGRDKFGVCSIQCAERLQSGDSLPIYIHHNPNFKLPANPDSPIIMIGPGTGVAPFRAFLEEREELEAKGRSWLFFGDQHFLTDFLYQVDWQKWLKSGVLTRMDVAFSRDTDKKVYVQHRMLEKSKEFYQWLQDGATIFVCGDEKHMAHDVHSAIATILQKEGGMSEEESKAYLLELQQQKRYLRDVY